MIVYDIQGNLITDYNLELGQLIPSVKIEKHEATPAIAEISRWEEKHYPNGGISRRKVIEQAAVAGVDAWEEEITIYTYTPYTEEELKQIEEERNKPSTEQRLTQLEEAFNLLLQGAVE